MVVSAAGATRCGPKHLYNEDQLRIYDRRHPVVARAGKGSVYVLSDGVSTTPRGGVAATIGVERVAGFFDRIVPARLESLAQIVSEIDWELREVKKGDAACTLALLWLHEGRATVLAVGDSPVYRARHGEVVAVTREARRGGLGSFLGMGPRVAEALLVWDGDVLPGDVYFLVTDGVTEVVRPEELLDVWWFFGGDVTEVAREVVRRVDERRGQDDATVVIVDVLGMEQVDKPGVQA